MQAVDVLSTALMQFTVFYCKKSLPDLVTSLKILYHSHLLFRSQKYMPCLYFSYLSLKAPCCNLHFLPSLPSSRWSSRAEGWGTGKRAAYYTNINIRNQTDLSTALIRFDTPHHKFLFRGKSILLQDGGQGVQNRKRLSQLGM